MQQPRFRLCFHPLFWIGLIILVLNDHVIKEFYPSFLTGKLSDFAGLFVLPVFLYSFLRRRHFSHPILLSSILVSGLFFTLLQFEATLKGYKFFLENLFGVSPNLVADKTDLLALFILPFTYIFILKKEKTKRISERTNFFRKLEPAIFLTTTLSLIATSFTGTSEKLINHNLVGANDKDEFLFRLEEEFLEAGFEIKGRSFLQDNMYRIGVSFDYPVEDSMLENK